MFRESLVNKELLALLATADLLDLLDPLDLLGLLETLAGRSDPLINKTKMSRCGCKNSIYDMLRKQ